MANQPSPARALGYFSLGLGTAQIIAPRQVAQLIGVRPGAKSVAAMRLVGLREIAAGVGILAQQRPTPWLWARVAGDVVDLALLGAALADGHNGRQRLAAALVMVSGVTAADVQTAAQLAEHEDGDQRPAGRRYVTRAITINRSPQDVAPHVPPQARLNPAPGGRGTEVRLAVEATPVRGPLSLWARLLGQTPDQQATTDLRALKQILETGEVIRSDATINGTHLFQRAGQPPSTRQLAEAHA